MAIDSTVVIFFVISAALALGLLALIFVIALHFRIKKIFRSANVPDLERLLKLHSKTLEDFVRFKAETPLHLKSLDDRIKNKMVSCNTLRFNPFQGEGAGGNQSFSSVFADEEGNGVILTSIHARERTNVFAKPLQKWQSEYELTEEEKRVLGESRKK